MALIHLEAFEQGDDIITAELWVTHWQLWIQSTGTVESLAGGGQLVGIIIV